MFFCVFDFFQKMKENKSTWSIIVAKSNSFVRFLDESSAWKNHYYFVWPLAWYNFINEKQNWKLQKLIVWADVRNLPREDDHAIRSSLKMAQSHKAVWTNMFLIDLGITLQNFSFQKENFYQDKKKSIVDQSIWNFFDSFLTKTHYQSVKRSSLFEFWTHNLFNYMRDCLACLFWMSYNILLLVKKSFRLYLT